MDTKENEVTASRCTDTTQHNSQPNEAMEVKDDVNSYKGPEPITEQGETMPKEKETIEILKVELVTSGQHTPPNDLNMNKKEEDIQEETQEHKDNNILDDVENSIQMESNTIEIINESTPAESEKSDAQNTSDVAINILSTTTGLSLLAEYDSDNENKSSDSDSVVEVPIASKQDYRNQVVEIHSNSDTDDNDSDVEYLNELRKTIEKRIGGGDDDEEEDGNDDDNEENASNRKYKPKLKVKGELLLEDLPPIQDLKITVPEDECVEFGKIHSIVDQLVLVSALPNSILLDLETVLFLEKGQKVLGEVFDVLGQVADPWYCVRFNSNKQIQEKEINVGDIVYVAPKTQYTQYVILSNLIKQKGSDASWENDIEPPPRFLDYSDDEQEQLARRQLRNKDRPVDNDDLTKRARTTEVDDNLSSVSGRSEHSIHHRNHRGGNRGGSSHYNSHSRSRNNGPSQYNQQPQNYHRGSWHSNYYRQPFPSHTQPPTNYGMQPPNQTYPSQQYPMYPMPPMHNIPPYASLPTQYGGAPPMLHQHNVPMMPNTYSVRPATLQGPHILPHAPLPPQQQYSPSQPPPPPGSQ